MNNLPHFLSNITKNKATSTWFTKNKIQQTNYRPQFTNILFFVFVTKIQNVTQTSLAISRENLLIYLICSASLHARRGGSRGRDYNNWIETMRSDASNIGPIRPTRRPMGRLHFVMRFLFVYLFFIMILFKH